MFAILLILGCVLLVIGSIHLLVVAFRESILWGLASLLLPLVDLVFTILHWDRTRTPFFTRLAGLALIVFAVIMNQPLGARLTERFGWEAASTSDSNAGDLTAQVEAQRLNVEQLEARFAVAVTDVSAEYKKMTAARVSLKATDAAEVEKFNVLAAEYQRKNLALKELQQGIASGRAELTRTLDERAKLAAKAKPRVVMYTTSTCPACTVAKRYFARKGVSYEEIDVQTSPAGRAEFQKLGGRGVPLILVGGERMEGFSEARLDAMLASSS